MATTDLAGRRLTDGIAGNGEAAWIPMLRGEDGQAVVEAAIVLPAMVFLLLLALQIRWLYELKVPFANRMIQAIWVAAKGGLLQSWRGWDLTGPRLGSQTGPDAIATSHALAAGIAVPDGTPEGIPIAALAAAARAGRYYLPVQAFYTMRMQSNPYRKWAHP